METDCVTDRVSFCRGDHWSAPAVQLSESVGCTQRMFAPNPVRGIPYAPRPDIRVTLSIVLSDSIVLLFLLREKEKEAKRKCHTNIPAANILTLLPAAGARKGGFLKKAPFKSPKNFYTAHAKLSASAPKVRRQPESCTAGAVSLSAAPQVPPPQAAQVPSADQPHRRCRQPFSPRRRRCPQAVSAGGADVLTMASRHVVSPFLVRK